MAQAKCIKCDHTLFESVKANILNPPHAYSFIQCAKCGSVVGILDQQSPSYLIKALADKLGHGL